MGFLALISGVNNSGKSAFAEKLAGQSAGTKYYIATMIPHEKEHFFRIEKHRKQREQYGFSTLELPYHLDLAPVTADSVVLLEDVSNLLANCMFEKKEDENNVFDEICLLQKKCKALVLVTISGLDVGQFQGETAAYIQSLNRLNQKLFNIADMAVTMQDAVPVFQKGELHDFF